MAVGRDPRGALGVAVFGADVSILLGALVGVTLVVLSRAGLRRRRAAKT